VTECQNVAISGSRPYANHTDGFYRESAASRCSVRDCESLGRRKPTGIFQQARGLLAAQSSAESNYKDVPGDCDGAQASSQQAREEGFGTLVKSIPHHETRHCYGE
jgi:hypothetical protein